MSPKSTQLCPRVGISLGDTGGVGPAVSWKALQAPYVRQSIIPLLFGPNEVIEAMDALGSLPLTRLQNSEKLPKNKEKDTVYVIDTTPSGFTYTLGEATTSGAQAAWAALSSATQALEQGHIDALCTAPANKHHIQELGHHFVGHTEYLAQRFGTTPLMLMLGEQIRMGLLSTHVPIAEVPSLVTKELLTEKMGILFDTLAQDFGIYAPRVALLGLNPHAGEQGRIGKEEQDILIPFVEQQNQKKRTVIGPYAADGFFGSCTYSKVDATMALYHDQGLVGFKAIAFENGVNYTAGLPVIRTSPVHGTAYELAPNHLASASSMRSALWAAYDIYCARHKIAKRLNKK